MLRRTAWTRQPPRVASRARTVSRYMAPAPGRIVGRSRGLAPYVHVCACVGRNFPGRCRAGAVPAPEMSPHRCVSALRSGPCCSSTTPSGRAIRARSPTPSSSSGGASASVCGTERRSWTARSWSTAGEQGATGRRPGPGLQPTGAVVWSRVPLCGRQRAASRSVSGGVSPPQPVRQRQGRVQQMTIGTHRVGPSRFG